MSSAGEPPHLSAVPSIFVSYASQDREAVRALRDGLAAAGLEVWYDENELGGGDAWDQKIRRQIRECTYFMPVISANADARHEGYFRREWRLAVERTLDMADDVTFLLPVVIDNTSQARARVPEKFLAVQWLTVIGGKNTPAFETWCSRLIRKDSPLPSAASIRHTAAPPAAQPATRPAGDPRAPYPPFPEQHPDRKLHFLFLVIGWMFSCAWIWYRQLPRRWRLVIAVVLGLVLLDKSCSEKREISAPSSAGRAKGIALANEIRRTYDTAARSPAGNVDLTSVGRDIANALTRDFGDNASSNPELLAIPFTAPAGDAEAAKFASTVFAALYGQLSVSAPGKVALGRPGASDGPASPLELASLRHASQAVYGSVSASGADQGLEVTVAAVNKRALLWTHHFALKGADPSAIADEIRAHITFPN
jgi:hypothetical protein